MATTNVLRLTVREATAGYMEMLEQLGLVTRLIAPDNAEGVPEGRTGVRTVYRTDPRYGGHKLILVTTGALQSELSCHPDKEDVILVNPDVSMKPLIWVFGLSRRPAFEEKARTAALAADDLVALEMPFNDPRLSIFTVHEEVPHYEVTVPGPGRNPSFWVTEPSDLPMSPVDLGSYRVELEAPDRSSSIRRT